LRKIKSKKKGVLSNICEGGEKKIWKKKKTVMGRDCISCVFPRNDVKSTGNRREIGRGEEDFPRHIARKEGLVERRKKEPLRYEVQRGKV